MILFVLAAASIGLIATSIPATAYEYHPLGLGTQWIYDNPQGGLHYMTITGEREVLGVSAVIRHQDEDTQTFENYWTTDVFGNLFLHGAFNYDGFGIAYLPPIKMVDAPLAGGKSWVTENIHTYYLDGTPWGTEPFNYPLQVYSEGVVTVPAGDFYAYGVGTYYEPPVIISRDGKSYNLLGRHIEHEDLLIEGNVTEWYTDGIGLPQWGYLLNAQYQLREYGSPTATMNTTWGRIRASYDPLK